MSQLGLAYPGWHHYEPDRGVIQPPPTYPPVTDGTDPVTGPYEIPPCPPLDDHGTVYWVGTERDRWEWLGDGMHVPDGRGALVDMRATIKEMMARGARIQSLPGRWTPDRVRETIESPLVWANGGPSISDR